MIVAKDGAVLVGLRAGGAGAGTWGLPGGFLEFGESFEECARREVREEAGIEITNLRFGRATNDIMPAEGKHTVTIYLEAEHAAGEPRAMSPREVERWEWRRWDDLPTPRYASLANLLASGYRPNA